MYVQYCSKDHQFESSSSLKHSYFGSLFVSDVLVDGEDEHEDEEEASAAREVPEVMAEVKVLIFIVLTNMLCFDQLERKEHKVKMIISHCYHSNYCSVN